MGKELMKRSLVLGALMAFVITGSAWAEASDLDRYFPQGDVTKDDFKNEGFTVSGNYIFLNPNDLGSNKSVIVQTNGNFKYSNDNMYFWAVKNGEPKGIIENVILKINNDMYFKNYTEITAGHAVNNEKQEVRMNKVIIDRCKINTDSSLLLFGGFANVNAVDSLVSKNSIVISDATIGATLEANSDDVAISIIGGNNNKWNSSENKVVIDNVKFRCLRDDIVDNCGVEIKGGRGVNNANENEVFIYNSTVDNMKVYGGQADNEDAITNKVYLCNVSINNGEIYGGYTNGNGEVKDNILNILGYFKNKERLIKGTANKIGGFSTINYDALKWKANASVIATKSFELDDSKQVTVNVNGLAEGSTPKRGEVMILLDTDEVSYNEESFDGKYLDESTSAFNSGTFLKAEGKIYQEDNDVKLKITRVGTNDQALVIGESRAAATAFANQGSELIEVGLDTLAREKSEKETKVFASVFGNASKYATGSHVKVNGWSGIVGVAKTNDDGLTAGAFFENGEGNYRTFNTFEGDFMRGDGEANYNGGGFFVRKDNPNGVYTEASLRAGNLQNELNNAVCGSEGLGGYDIDTFYYGAHIGVGKIIPRGNEGDSIDVYGKFIYTHHDSEDFTIDGDKFHFDSVDSERLRLGFRINEVQTNKLSMYYGAAWEYEFGGDADNTVVGYDLSTPSLGGSTVIGEVGMHYNANEKWSFDMNVRGYSGQRDGFTGSIQANYRF